MTCILFYGSTGNNTLNKMVGIHPLGTNMVFRLFMKSDRPRVESATVDIVPHAGSVVTLQRLRADLLEASRMSTILEAGCYITTRRIGPRRVHGVAAAAPRTPTGIPRTLYGPSNKPPLSGSLFSLICNNEQHQPAPMLRGDLSDDGPEQATQMLGEYGFRRGYSPLLKRGITCKYSCG